MQTEFEVQPRKKNAIVMTLNSWAYQQLTCSSSSKSRWLRDKTSVSSTTLFWWSDHGQMSSNTDRRGTHDPNFPLPSYGQYFSCKPAWWCQTLKTNHTNAHLFLDAGAFTSTHQDVSGQQAREAREHHHSRLHVFPRDAAFHGYDDSDLHKSILSSSEVDSCWLIMDDCFYYLKR